MQGRLVAVKDGAAQVQSGDLTYEVLIPAADSMMLAASVGEQISFHTLHYMEGQGQGSSFWPRLIGFQTPQERDFFELFTTVKGIGNRRALRALQLPFSRVAEAISERDHGLLQTLPEIGKRTAEAICVELKGKVDPYVGALRREGAQHAPAGNGAASASASTSTSATEPKSKGRTPKTTVSKNGTAGNGTAHGGTSRSELITMANGAVEVLVQLGHSRPDARDLVERVISSDNVPATASEIVTAALR